MALFLIVAFYIGFVVLVLVATCKVCASRKIKGNNPALLSPARFVPSPAVVNFIRSWLARERRNEEDITSDTPLTQVEVEAAIKSASFRFVLELSDESVRFLRRRSSKIRTVGEFIEMLSSQMELPPKLWGVVTVGPDRVDK